MVAANVAQPPEAASKERIRNRNNIQCLKMHSGSVSTGGTVVHSDLIIPHPKNPPTEPTRVVVS